MAKALEEGIRFAEGLTPLEVLVDDYGHARALRVGLDRSRDNAAEEFATEQVLPAKTILVAAGTQPNTVLGREDPTRVAINGRYFQALDEAGEPVTPEPLTKPADVQVLMSVRPDGRAVSFFGDLHPSFAGNVVKAMSSAKQGYPVVSRMLARTGAAARPQPALFAQLDGELRATVHEVVRLTPTIVEVVVRAPMAARAFKPGQFYRLQNFETLAPASGGTRLAMEGLALTGAWTDKAAGLLSTIVLEMGGSSDLCAQLRPGEPVILMGPTGHATEIPAGETVLLIGGGLGNAVLFSIGQAMKANGCRVIYFAGYKRAIDRYKVGEIERAADTIVWCSRRGCRVHARTGLADLAFVGNIVQAIDAYGRGDLGPALRFPGRRRPHPRHRLGRHDECRGPRAPRDTRRAPQAAAQGHRLDQLAHAVHDEGDLRPVPADAQGPRHRRRERRVLLLQPGPGPRPGALRRPPRPPLAEQRAGEVDPPLDRSLAAHPWAS